MKGPESHRPGELHFHYNREERESRLPDDIKNRQKGSFFSRNRHLMVIFLDILIMTAVGMFLLPYFRGGDKTAADYRFSMNVSLFDGTILTAVRAIPDGDPEEEEVECLLRVLPGGREVRLFGYLNPEDEEQILRGREPYSPGDEKIEAVIRLGGEEIVLKAKIPRE